MWQAYAVGGEHDVVEGHASSTYRTPDLLRGVASKQRRDGEVVHRRASSRPCAAVKLRGPAGQNPEKAKDASRAPVVVAAHFEPPRPRPLPRGLPLRLASRLRSPPLVPASTRGAALALARSVPAPSKVQAAVPRGGEPAPKTKTPGGVAVACAAPLVLRALSPSSTICIAPVVPARLVALLA